MVKREQLEKALITTCRKSFYAFCRYYDPVFYRPSKKHLKKLCVALQLVAIGRILKLAVSLPPRGGKSYTVSLWCAWIIGNNYLDPYLSIMRNSYGGDLAEKFSYDIRDIIRSPKFLSIFPEVKLKKDHARVEDWAITTAAQSTYFCAGVGGAITGKGCRTVAISDDLIKNLEDALSNTILDKTWGWYTSTHKSRMEQGCPEVHITTRWSNKDVVGRILAAEKDKWTTITIPALDENGKSFCEDVKSTDEYLEMKDLLDPFVWEAEFMQKPIEAKGLLFPPDQLNYFTMKEINKYIDQKQQEQFDAVIGYTDTADEGTDFLASPVAGIIGDKVFIYDIVFTQDPIELTQPAVARKIIDSDQSFHVVESNNGGKGYALELRRLLAEARYNCHIKWKKTTTNKNTRILMNAGRVKSNFYFRSDYLPGSDYGKFMRQLTEYVRMGKNEHDDAPEVVAELAMMIFQNNSVRFLNRSAA